MSSNSLDLSRFPEEIQLNIYKYLDPSDLARLSCVNKEIYRIAQDNLLWKGAFAPRFPHQMRKAAKKGVQDYKKLFIQAIETERRIDNGIYSQKALFPTELLAPNETVDCIKSKGNRLVTGSHYGSIRIWDIERSECTQILKSNDSVCCLQFKDNLLITGGDADRSSSSKGLISLWDIASGKLLKNLLGHDFTVYCLHFKKNILASGSRDRTIRIWDIDSGECTKILEEHTENIYCLKIMGNLLASGSADETVRIWNIQSGVCLKVLSNTVSDDYSFCVYCLDFKNAALAIVGCDKEIRIFDLKKEGWTLLFTEENIMNNVQLDDRRLSTCEGTCVRFWNMESNEFTNTFSMESNKFTNTLSVESNDGFHIGLRYFSDRIRSSTEFKDRRLIYQGLDGLIHILDFKI